MAKKARKKAVGPTSKAQGKTRGKIRDKTRGKTDAADRIGTAALALAAGRGWRRVRLVDIAIEAGVTLADPADFKGNDAEVAAVFDATLNQLERLIGGLLELTEDKRTREGLEQLRKELTPGEA